MDRTAAYVTIASVFVGITAGLKAAQNAPDTPTPKEPKA